MFLPFATVQQQVSDLLKNASVADLPAWWTTIITNAQLRAYNEIFAALSGRGFTAAQIAAWDRGPEFEGNMTCYYALMAGGAAESIDEKALASLDRSKELTGDPQHPAVQITNGGVYQYPQGNPGTVGTGRMSPGGSIFSWPDPSDPRLGRPTRW